MQCKAFARLSEERHKFHLCGWRARVGAVRPCCGVQGTTAASGLLPCTRRAFGCRRWLHPGGLRRAHSKQVEKLIVSFWSAWQAAVLRFAATMRHVRSTAEAVQSISSVARLHPLLVGTRSTRWPRSQYMPSPPVSSLLVLPVAHQANHSFKRTGLRPAA